MAFPSWDEPNPMSRYPVVGEVVGTILRRVEGEHRRLRYVSRDCYLFAWTAEPAEAGSYAAVVYEPLTAARERAKREADVAAWSPVEERRFSGRDDAQECAYRWYVARVMRRGTPPPTVVPPVRGVCGGVRVDPDLRSWRVEPRPPIRDGKRGE